MSVSQNGWEANNRSLIVSIDVPGGKLPVRSGDVATIFSHLANRFHNEVEPLIWPGCWGYAERLIRGGVETSNHASGTAIDLNAPRHPLGTLPSANYSTAQIDKIHEIVGYYEGVIRWGGDYTGRKDGMHFEVNAGPAEVARIAAKLRGVPVPAPRPTPARATIKLGARGQLVWDLQRKLTKSYPAYNKYAPTGYFGNLTERGVKEFQRRSGLVADGIVGPKTWRALGL